MDAGGALREPPHEHTGMCACGEGTSIVGDPFMRKGSSSGRRHTAVIKSRKQSNGDSNGAPHAPAASTRARKDPLQHQPRMDALGADARDGGNRLQQATLLGALRAFKDGDFSVRLPIDLEGIDGKIADAFNDGIALNEKMSEERERMSFVVGKEGKISQRAGIGPV